MEGSSNLLPPIHRVPTFMGTLHETKKAYTHQPHNKMLKAYDTSLVLQLGWASTF
jgi:hypothetical protein